jgi:hypothetical protein
MKRRYLQWISIVVISGCFMLAALQSVEGTAAGEDWMAAFCVDNKATGSDIMADAVGSDGYLGWVVGDEGEQNLVYINTLPIVVTSPTDSGEGSLRQALLNALPGDTITFAPAVFPPTAPDCRSSTSQTMALRSLMDPRT